MLLIIAIATASMSGGQSAYAKSYKAKIRSTINTFFGAARNINKKRMKRCFAGEGRLFRDSERFYEMLKPYTKKIRWKVRRIKKKPKKVVAYVVVRYPSLYASYWSALLKGMEGSDSSHIDKAYILDIIERELNRNEYHMVHTILKIRMQKVGKKWKIKEMKDNIMDVLYCGYISAVNDFMGIE